MVRVLSLPQFIALSLSLFTQTITTTMTMTITRRLTRSRKSPFLMFTDKWEPLATILVLKDRTSWANSLREQALLP